MQGAQVSDLQHQQGHPPGTAEAPPVTYSDANVAAVLSLSPFSEISKLRDDWRPKPLIRGRYSGMCGGDPAQRERREDFEYIVITSAPSTSPQTLGSASGQRYAWGQVEAFSRSAAGKTIDPARQRTPLALEKSMHFLVEHYLRVPHTPLVYTEPFRIWGYLWDRFRGIRTTWGPQLPPSNVSLQGYVDSESHRILSPEELHRESYRRVRWLEFTVAALAVGGAYLCCSPEGCQRFMQDKKQFLESMSQCFTDLTVFYRAEQRHRNAEFFSVLLLLYGLQQELKVEDRSSFCCFHTVIVNGEPRPCPENTAESVNLAQVYRELEKQPYMLETQPVRVALELIHCWAARQWFRFFDVCKSVRMTPLQRAVVFQSFTYCRYRAVLDLVLPNYYVYPKLRVRHTLPITELADQLMMHHDHCLEFLKRMGLGAQLELKTPQQQPRNAPSFAASDPSAPALQAAVTPTTASPISEKDGWYLNLCHPNSDPLITADELEKRCENKRVLFFPTDPTFFGFHVSHEAYRRFPDAKGFPNTGTANDGDSFLSTGGGQPVGRGAVRSPPGLDPRAAPQSRRSATAAGRGDSQWDSEGEEFYMDEYCSEGEPDEEKDAYSRGGEEHNSPPQRRSTASPATATAPCNGKEKHLLRQLGCPVNLMEVLEIYCPPYNSDVAALRLSDVGEEFFTTLPKHRAEMLRRCYQMRRHGVHRKWVSRDDDSTPAVSDEEMLDWAEGMERESVSTASSFFDDTDDEDMYDEEDGEGETRLDAAAAPRPLDPTVPPSRDGALTLEVINESRKLVAAIRNNPLYAAAAAEGAEKNQCEGRESLDVRGAAASTVVTGGSPQTSSPEPFSPTPRTMGKQTLPPTGSDSCVVAESQTTTATLPTQRHRDFNDVGVAVQTASQDRTRNAEKKKSTQQHIRDREEAAEAMVPHQHPQRHKSTVPPPSVARPLHELDRDIPKPFAPATSNMFTPGKRKPAFVSETDNATPIPTSGQREGSSASNSSSNSSAPMLGYSHLKPLKETPPDAVDVNGDSQNSSNLDETPAASAADVADSSPSDTSSAESNTATPSPTFLWSGQRPLPVPPPMSTIDSFTPRDPIDESCPPSAAGAAAFPPMSHGTRKEVALDVASEKGSDEDAAVDAQASSSPGTLSKRHTAEVALQRGACTQWPSSTHTSASHPNIFSRVCVPLIEGYLSHWSRLMHGDDMAVHTAAEHILDIRETEAASATATYRAGSGSERSDDATPSASTRRWPMVQQRVSKLLRAEEAAAAAAAMWRRQRRLRSTASAIVRVARQLMATAVLRGNMSEYGQLMWDISLSEVEPSRIAGRIPTRGNSCQPTQTVRRDAARACAVVDLRDSDDARVARLSRGCSVAMLSADDVDSLLAATQATSSRVLVNTAHVAKHMWSSDDNALSTCASRRLLCAEDHSGLGPAMLTSKAALSETVHALLRHINRGATTPAHNSLDEYLSCALNVSVDSINVPRGSRDRGAAATLQLTSVYVWVSAENDDGGAECPSLSPGAVAGANSDSAAALAHLFRCERERWLVSIMLPPVALTAMETSADVGASRNGQSPWRQPNASRRAGKRRRSSVDYPPAMEDTNTITWLGDVDMDPHKTSPPYSAETVARLFQRDNFTWVPVVPFAVSPPMHRGGADSSEAHTLPLTTRITLYACGTQVLPRLRVRRNGGMKSAQQLRIPTTSGGHANVKQVTATQESTRMPAMSHAHYTALLAIDLGEPQYIERSRRVFTAIAESHVAYTTASCARDSATSREWNNHPAGVLEQNCVEGVLMCLLCPPGQVVDTVSAAAQLESLFWCVWHLQHGTGDAGDDTTTKPLTTSAPVVVIVETVYGDTEGAQDAMKVGMQTLLSTYIQQVMVVLAGDE